MKMTRFLIIAVLIIFSFSSCQNYESEKYIKMENEAINDIILEITKFEEMKELNKFRNEKLKLYVLSTLDTITAYTIKPTGYDIGANGIDYSKERIERNKNKFEKDLRQYEFEKKIFIDLKNGKIKTRELNNSIKNEKFNIELITREKIDGLENFDTKKNEFGYLFISRIVFNRNFTRGYLHFNFICGDGCAWDSNIEIKRVNGKWKITEYFSGGIA
ncbi:hypothetical protein [uncultured Tenacibaculum sp.]|uniref:hypothetical protein n=1 Tax=uncultured Tenacibaculum sp. TaxID=174713 RepID=UPI0026181165|nr:hypothetical protein [uncultured Tenacibaculum sp.]